MKLLNAVMLTMVLAFAVAADVPVASGSCGGVEETLDPKQDSKLTKILRNVAAYYGTARNLVQVSLKEMRNVQDILWSAQSILWNINATASSVERIANTINTIDDGRTGIEIIKDLELNIFQPSEDIYYDYRVQLQGTVTEQIPEIGARFYADAKNSTFRQDFENALNQSYALVTGRQAATEQRNAAKFQMDKRDLENNPGSRMAQVATIQSGRVIAGMETNLADIEKQTGAIAGQREGLRRNIKDVNMTSNAVVQMNLSRDELVLQYQAMGVQAQRTEMLSQVLSTMSMRYDGIAEQKILEWESLKRRSQELDRMMSGNP